MPRKGSWPLVLRGRVRLRRGENMEEEELLESGMAGYGSVECLIAVKGEAEKERLIEVHSPGTTVCCPG